MKHLSNRFLILKAPAGRALCLILTCFTLLLVGCEQTQDTAADAAEATEDAAGQAAGEVGQAMDELGGETFEVELTGAGGVPNPGDPDGSGEAEVTLDMDDGEVCFEIEVEGIAEPTAAHIHQGAAGASGSPVVNFAVDQNGLEGCVTGVDMAVLQAIEANPADYYVNVHNSEYPGGALRGQLDD